MVKQLPKFEFINLLSEVGGFLGLLLGASMLTVCELIDYIILKILYSCGKRKKVRDGIECRHVDIVEQQI